MGTHNCVNEIREAFKRQGSYQYFLCCGDYVERVVASFITRFNLSIMVEIYMYLFKVLYLYCFNAPQQHIPCSGPSSLSRHAVSQSFFYYSKQYYWFQPKMSTFLLCALAFYDITKQAHKYLSPNLFVLKYQIAQYTINSLNYVLGYFYFLTIYSSVAKGVPVSVFRVYPFIIFTYQNSSPFVGKYLCIPLSNSRYI